MFGVVCFGLLLLSTNRLSMCVVSLCLDCCGLVVFAFVWCVCFV